MDQLQTNVDETTFLPPSLPKRHLLNQSTHQPHLPKLVPLQPPASNRSSKEQNRQVNVFKKVISRQETGLPASRLSGETDQSDLDERIRKFINSEVHRRVKPTSSTTLPNTSIPHIRLDPASMPSPPKVSPVDSEPPSPTKGRIESVILTFDRVVAIESISYSKPRLISQGARPKTTPPRPLSFITQHVTDAPLESCSPPPILPSPPPLKSAPTLLAEKKHLGNTSKHSFRKRVPSSRRTSRGLMLGQPNIGPTSLAKPLDKKATHVPRKRSSVSSLGSVIKMSDISRAPSLRYRRSFRHVQALKRQSKPPTLTIPENLPLEIPPLAFSPFLPEFSDHSSDCGSSSSTPSIITPPSFIMELPSVLKREQSKALKNVPRRARCPGSFLNLDSPTTPLSFFTNEEPWLHYGTSDKSSISKSEAKSTKSAAQTPPSLPLSDSLRGHPKRNLPKPPSERKAPNAAKERPKQRKAMRPKLTLQVPQPMPSQITIYRPVASIMKSTDDIKIDMKRIRPLPSIPITRQKSV